MPLDKVDLHLSSGEVRRIREALARQLDRERRLLRLLEGTCRLVSERESCSIRMQAQKQVVEGYEQLLRKITYLRGGGIAAVGTKGKRCWGLLRELSTWVAAACIGTGLTLIFLPVGMRLIVVGAAIFLLGWALSCLIPTFSYYLSTRNLSLGMFNRLLCLIIRPVKLRGRRRSLERDAFATKTLIFLHSYKKEAGLSPFPNTATEDF